MDVKELELPQEQDAEQRERLKPGASQSGSLSLRQTSHRSDKPPDHLAEMGAETGMGQG